MYLRDRQISSQGGRNKQNLNDMTLRIRKCEIAMITDSYKESFSKTTTNIATLSEDKNKEQRIDEKVQKNEEQKQRSQEDVIKIRQDMINKVEQNNELVEEFIIENLTQLDEILSKCNEVYRSQMILSLKKEKLLEGSNKSQAEDPKVEQQQENNQTIPQANVEQKAGEHSSQINQQQEIQKVDEKPSKEITDPKEQQQINNLPNNEKIALESSQSPEKKQEKPEMKSNNQDNTEKNDVKNQSQQESQEDKQIKIQEFELKDQYRCLKKSEQYYIYTCKKDEEKDSQLTQIKSNQTNKTIDVFDNKIQIARRSSKLCLSDTPLLTKCKYYWTISCNTTEKKDQKRTLPSISATKSGMTTSRNRLNDLKITELIKFLLQWANNSILS